jgi:3-oxoacyl-[acyl-carrier protein] reductase
MTDTMPNHSMFAKPETGLDTFHPAWPAQLIVFLASDAAADVNGQGFVVWGGAVMLVGGWHVLNQISQADALTAQDLIARKDELFGTHPRQPGYM